MSINLWEIAASVAAWFGSGHRPPVQANDPWFRSATAVSLYTYIGRWAHRDACFCATALYERNLTAQVLKSVNNEHHTGTTQHLYISPGHSHSFGMVTERSRSPLTASSPPPRPRRPGKLRGVVAAVALQAPAHLRGRAAVRGRGPDRLLLLPRAPRSARQEPRQADRRLTATPFCLTPRRPS